MDSYIRFSGSILHSLRLSNVIFETDCKLVAYSVNMPRTELSEFSFIIKECSMLIAFCSNLRVRFIRRQVAHCLAKVAPTMPSFRNFYHVPRCIALFIASEIN